MIYVRIRGGLGNQLFQYAAARSYALDINDNLCLDLSGITNEGHNVLALDQFNINASSVNNCNIWQKKISKLFSSLSYRIGKKINYNLSYKFDVLFSFVLNLFGVYTIDNGYMKFKKSITKNKYINGYLQSDRYFDKNKETLIKELTLKNGLSKENELLADQMKKNNSVCIHIRRGDFVDIGGIVCTHQYYIEAVKYLKEKLKDVEFYVFSNDINWVKENIKFPTNVNYIDKMNSSYEEIVLMSSCNNFIISNSTFSWWGQYLSSNDDKIVIAPDKWFVDGQREDIYQQNWLIMDKNGKFVKDRGIKC